MRAKAVTSPPRGVLSSRRNPQAAKAVREKKARKKPTVRQKRHELREFVKTRTERILNPNEPAATNRLPLVFLYDVYNSSKYQLEDRIAAAKACLPYLHKRLPQEIDLGGNGGTRLRIEDLARLSDEELVVFEALLRKLQVATSGRSNDPGHRFLEDRRQETLYDDESGA